MFDELMEQMKFNIKDCEIENTIILSNGFKELVDQYPQLFSNYFVVPGCRGTGDSNGTHGKICCCFV